MYVVLGYLVAFFTIEYTLIYKPVKNLEDKRKAILDTYFKAWVEAAQINGQKPGIRINVMLVRIWPSKKFPFISRHFFQFYGYNMVGYPDGDLHFPITSGFCGWVLKQCRRKPHFQDLRSLTPQGAMEQFNFSEKFFERTKHIKSIVCVPLLRIHKPLIGYGEKQDFWGVFNVDALDDPGVDFLQHQETLEDIYSAALFIEEIFK